MQNILRNYLGEPNHELLLPWPPSVNEYHQPAKINGKLRIIKSTKVRKYLDKSIVLAFRQLIANLNIHDNCVIQLDLHPPTLRSYDVDNRAKAILDTLSQAKFWVDDDQCQSLLINKCEKIKGGEVRVLVWVV